MVSRCGNSKLFSLSARLASGDAECVSGTIACSFELKQSKMAIHKEETKDYPLGLFELLPKPQPR